MKKSTRGFLCGMGFYFISSLAFANANTLDTSPAGPADINGSAVEHRSNPEHGYQQPYEGGEGHWSHHHAWCEQHPDQCQRHHHHHHDQWQEHRGSQEGVEPQWHNNQ